MIYHLCLVLVPCIIHVINFIMEISKPVEKLTIVFRSQIHDKNINQSNAGEN